LSRTAPDGIDWFELDNVARVAPSLPKDWGIAVAGRKQWRSRATIFSALLMRWPRARGREAVLGL